MVYTTKAQDFLTHLEEMLIKFSHTALGTQQVYIMLSLLFSAFNARELLFKDCVGKWRLSAEYQSCLGAEAVVTSLVMRRPGQVILPLWCFNSRVGNLVLLLP